MTTGTTRRGLLVRGTALLAWGGVASLFGACGGTDESEASATPVRGIDGIWFGQVSGMADFVGGAQGMVLADGTLQMLIAGELHWHGRLATDAAGNVTLTDGGAVHEGNGVFPSGSNVAPLTWSGAVLLPDRTLRGRFASDGSNGDFLLTAQDALADGPASVADLSGAYHYEHFGGGFFASDFRFAADGTIKGTEERGTFTGSVQALVPGRNGYRVQLSYFDLRAPGVEDRHEYVTYTGPAPRHDLMLFPASGEGSPLPLFYVGP